MAPGCATCTCPFAALGVDLEATTTAVESAWRRKSLDCHPDKNPNDPLAKAKFQALTEAKDCLLDPKLRAAALACAKAAAEAAASVTSRSRNDSATRGPQAKRTHPHQPRAGPKRQRTQEAASDEHVFDPNLWKAQQQHQPFGAASEEKRAEAIFFQHLDRKLGRHREKVDSSSFAPSRPTTEARIPRTMVWKMKAAQRKAAEAAEAAEAAAAAKRRPVDGAGVTGKPRAFAEVCKGSGGSSSGTSSSGTSGSTNLMTSKTPTLGPTREDQMQKPEQVQKKQQDVHEAHGPSEPAPFQRVIPADASTFAAELSMSLDEASELAATVKLLRRMGGCATFAELSQGKSPPDLLGLVMSQPRLLEIFCQRPAGESREELHVRLRGVDLEEAEAEKRLFLARAAVHTYSGWAQRKVKHSAEKRQQRKHVRPSECARPNKFGDASRSTGLPKEETVVMVVDSDHERDNEQLHQPKSAPVQSATETATANISGARGATKAAANIAFRQKQEAARAGAGRAAAARKEKLLQMASQGPLLVDSDSDSDEGHWNSSLKVNVNKDPNLEQCSSAGAANEIAENDGEEDWGKEGDYWAEEFRVQRYVEWQAQQEEARLQEARQQARQAARQQGRVKAKVRQVDRSSSSTALPLHSEQRDSNVNLNGDNRQECSRTLDAPVQSNQSGKANAALALKDAFAHADGQWQRQLGMTTGTRYFFLASGSLAQTLCRGNTSRDSVLLTFDLERKILYEFLEDTEACAAIWVPWEPSKNAWIWTVVPLPPPNDAPEPSPPSS